METVWRASLGQSAQKELSQISGLPEPLVWWRLELDQVENSQPELLLLKL